MFSKTPTSPLLNRHAVAISTGAMRTPIHGHTEIPPGLAAGTNAFEPVPPPPACGTELGDVTGEGVPPTAPTPADGLDEAEGEGDVRGLGLALGEGRGVGAVAGGLIV